MSKGFKKVVMMTLTTIWTTHL